MNKVGLLEHLKLLGLAFFSLIRSPESVPGYLLETVSEWSRGRKWRWVWSTLPMLLVNLGFWVTIGFYTFRSSSSIVRASMTQVSKRIASDELANLAFEEHYIRNGVKERTVPDLEEADEVTDSLLGVRPSLVADDDFVKSDKFLESEVLLNRATRVSPDSVQATYQLALLSSLDTKLADPQKIANQLMEKLAENKADPFPPAHAWMAVALVGRPTKLSPTEVNQLENYLKVASQWKAIEPALLSIYSNMCLTSERPEPEKALAIAKLAAESRPELNLQYAQLCKMLGSKHDAEFKRAAKEAEKVFSDKIRKPNRTDADRLGLAKVLLLLEQRDKAMEILQQGITEDPKAHQPVRRGLADLYIAKFRSDNEALIKKSLATKQDANASDGESDNSKTDDESEDEQEVVWNNLQEAAKIDRDNPIVGQEIALQWRKLSTPPADLLEVLRYQLTNDLATPGARLMIAELYLIKGRVNDAKIQWETILKKDPYVIPALNNLSVILSRENPPKLTLAIELIERAYRMQPMNAEMCDTYGEVYMNAGRPIDAIAKLEESIRIDPTRIATRKRLASCYHALGMNDMAAAQESQIKSLEEAQNQTKSKPLLP